MSRLKQAGILCTLGLASSLHAAVLTLAPDNEIVEVSADVTVNVQVSELSGAQVGAYDLIVSWDPAVLSLENAAIGTELDGPDRSFHTSSTSPGAINLAEFSFDSLSGQSEPVVLATLSFVALAAGNASLGAAGNVAGAAVLLGDAAGLPLPADISVTDIKVNGAPIAQSQSVITYEDEPIPITLGGSDANGDDLEFVVTRSPTIGILSGTPPDLTYTPDTNKNGSDSFAFTVSDGTVTSEPATVDITVNAVNDAPLVTNDETLTLEDTPVMVSVLDNDSDVEFSPLLVTGVTGGVLGVASTDGAQVTYVPALNLSGVDLVTYTVSDGDKSSTGSLTVTITPVNDIPNAVDDDFSIDEDHTLDVAAPGVLANDSDVDGDSMIVTIMENPLHGSLQLETDGAFSYSPQADFFGTDGFTYRIDDGNGGAATASVTLTVNSVNDVPNADAGVDQHVVLGDEAILNGSASFDPDAGPQPLSYLWRFLSVAPDSMLNDNAIAGADTAMPSFAPDRIGSYVLELEVFDGEAKDLDNVSVQAGIVPCPAPPFEDPDGDGVCEAVDACPISDMGSVVVIDNCDTGVVNDVFDDGCTLVDEIMACADGARNHGQFVSCVAKLTNRLKKDGVITGAEKGSIQRCAAQADIP